MSEVKQKFPLSSTDQVSGGSPQDGWYDVTPESAARLLKHNDVNRTLRRSTVTQYANIMRMRQWVANGEPIIISHTGRLLNGQHRLSACVASGEMFRTYVIVLQDEGRRKQEEEVFETIDSGKLRNGSDALSILGVKNTTAIAASIQLVSIYRQGWRRRRNPGKGGQYNLTNAQVAWTYQDSPQVWDITGLCVGRNSKAIRGWLSQSALGAVFFLIAKSHGFATAENFATKLVSGEGLIAGDPLLAVRSALQSAAMKQQKVPRLMQLAILIQAFNERSRGRTRKAFKLMSTNYTPGPSLVGFAPDLIEYGANSDD